MASKRLFLSNDAIGNTDAERVFVYAQNGNHTTATNVTVFVAPEAGEVTGVFLATRTMTTSTDRTLTATVSKVVAAGTATALCTTNPSFISTATGAGAPSTYNTGTGITQAVLKTDGSCVLAKGNLVVCALAIAGSNGTVGTDAAVQVHFKPYAWTTATA
jgi:hypothetical protein